MKAVQIQDQYAEPHLFRMTDTLPEEKKHILIVDDEFSNRLILRNILLHEYEVHECENGREAMAFVEKCRPDLILLDVMMPLMNGYEFCCAMKSNPETVSIPILFITLLADTQQVVKAFGLGAADYLTKPFYGKEVLARIRRQLLIEEKNASLRKHVENLEELVARETRELMQAKHDIAFGRLVQGIIHNLNNPSTVIAGGLRRMRDAHRSLTESYESGADLNNGLLETHLRRLERSLDFVENASERLLGVVAPLRNKIMANKGTDSQLIDINTVIRDEVSFLKANSFFANQVEKKLLLCDQALPVLAVPSELAQLFNNLFSNSIDALKQQCGSPEISIETRMVGSRVEIKTHDNGCGISKENQEHIFAPFFTTKEVVAGDDEEPLRNLSGTGLGLFMCHNTVQSLRGEIGVKSSPGQGTTFYITLPMAIQEESPQV